MIFIQQFPFDFRKYTYFHAFFIKISKYIVNRAIISVTIIIIHFLKAFFILGGKYVFQTLLRQNLNFLKVLKDLYLG